MVVANPIYDTVFKFLMEDERIARTILSALLKRDIVKVEIRPHEYANTKRESLSIFRIDFAGTVREPDGSEKLILIELQKTWLPTETLRFRQYLAVQYDNAKNIVEDSKDQHALPMVAVYLLGHCVGDIEEPVIYVNHQAYDYDDKLVTKGIPNAFVDSLTHDSIIVQIPRLHGKINNRLDEVLSIFDQTYKNGSNQHMLDLDDSCYAEDDVEMQRILRRLLIAAADVDMRMDMNVEDEYYSIIEKQDTDILMKTRELAEKSAQLNEKTAQLNEKTAQLNKKTAQLNKKTAQLNEVNSQLNEANSQLAQQQDNNRKLVKLLLATGMSIDDIAKTTGLTSEEISSM